MDAERLVTQVEATNQGLLVTATGLSELVRDVGATLTNTVSLGKTIEIGMIPSELVRRGRDERILIVTPKHVLEQMHFDMCTRFGLPFVRLDSVGMQLVR